MVTLARWLAGLSLAAAGASVTLRCLFDTLHDPARRGDVHVTGAMLEAILGASRVVPLVGLAIGAAALALAAASSRRRRAAVLGLLANAAASLFSWLLPRP